jgi:gliding motility-associated-like protein
MKESQNDCNMNRLLLIQLLLPTAFLALFTGLQPLQAKSEHNGPSNSAKAIAAAERRVTPPEILNVPNDTTVSDICSIPPKDSLEVNDMEDGMLPKVFPTDTPDPMSIDPCVGDTILRVWQAMDSDGNITRDTQVIIVLPDNQAPTFGNVGVLDTTMSCENAQSGGYATWATNIQLTLNSNITDCSQPVFIGLAAPLPMAFNQACDTLFVAFNYADDCGNTGVFETMFITTDINPPVLMGLPPDTIQVSCDTLDVYLMNNPPGMVTAMDGCTPGLMPSYTQDTIAIATTCPDRAFDLRRTWAVSDSCGNLAQSTHIVRVRDLRGPTFSEPEDLTISCDADPLDLMITGTVLDTMDNCGGPIDLTFSDVIFDEDVNCPHSFKINRTWTARDLCGNASLRPQIITVKDTIPPTFLVPADTTVNCGLENDFMVTGVPTMLMDNCDAGLSYQEQPVETIIPGNCPNNFTIQRAWVVEDSCGNRTTQIQTITVIDTIAPMISAAAADRIITCMAGTNITQEFFNWINSNGGAAATDACTLTEDLEWRRYKAGTDTLVSMPDLMCPAAGDTILMQAVDFVAIDLCGNADTTRAVFIVIDNSPPIIKECPQDVVVETDLSVCEATFVLQPPLVEEECAANIIMESISRSTVLTAGPGQAGTTPVNPVELSFAVSNPLPINAAGDATLSISLINADAEGATEFFTVFGEDGIVLGRTGRAPIQCSNSDTTFTIPAEKINAWALDGVITIRLEPNIPPALSGSFAINNICLPNSQVDANLSFNVRDFAQLRYQYKINNGPTVTVQPAGPATVVLPLGENTIMYYVSDCAGNQDSCVYKVRVEDREPPILACPTDISVGLDPGTCSAMVTLPFPSGVTDNCGVAEAFEATMPLDTAEAWLVFREDPNLNDYLPDPKTYTFQGVAANAVGPVDLTLDLRGDFSTTGAFVRVFGDSGGLLGSTPIGTANCNVPGQAIFTIPADTFNIWAADGEVTFVIEPNPIQVPPGVPGHGINPCNSATVSTDGDVDSISYIFATLSYREITPFYFAQGATDIPYTQMSLPSVNPTHEFNVGETRVSYVIADQHGNLDTCTYSVFVIDNEPPTALCQATIVEINPSGLEVDTVSVMEFDAGSFDNCGIDTMYLTPNTFTCEQAGTTVNATLTVIDGSGNVSTCTRPIRIEAEGPSPTFSPGICGGDTLYLFANPPVAQGGVVYTYRWFNPNGLLVSTQQNPIIPNVSAADAGAYVLQITGLTGCVAQEVVNVTITNLPLTPSINTNQNVCSEDNIVLNSSIALNNAVYRWYQGLPPGNLLSATNTPQFVIPAPHQPGPRQYYMTIEANGCISEPSLPITVTATNRPIAIINNSPEITLCEGEPITLGTFVTGVTYAWSGPSGFASSSQFPTVISQSTLANAGVYQLVVTQNGCSSLPANLVVNMLPKPARPALTVDSGPICEGQTLALKALPSGAATYHWVRPNLSEFTTTTNLFLLPNATDIYEGPWYVYTRQFGCRSDNSNTVNVVINEVPNVMVSADPPAVCQNTALQLFAAPGIPGATYQWTGPNNYASVAQNPVINNISLAGQGNYRVRITTPQGCTDTAAVAVTVLPSARIDAVSNTAPACLYGPTNIALQATIFPPDNGSYTYQWSGPGTYSSIDSVAIIPNATAANNGNYQLVVFTGDGCRSAPASTLVNTQNAPPMPPIPTLSTATQPPFCSGDALTLSIPPYSASGVIYNWVTPAGPTATNMPTLSLSNLSPDDSGPYRLFVTANGCNSDTSFMLPIAVNAIPQAIALSNSPVCEGNPLQLTALAPTGAAYQWTGPFTSSLPSPSVSAADPSLHSGVYTLLVTVNGCTSAPTSTNVIVNEMPNTPLASNSGPVCISDLGAALALSVAPGSATSGATYTWYGNGDSLGMTQSLNFLLSDFANFPDGTYSFWAEASLNNCFSDPSLPTVATISAIPSDTAFAGIDQDICISQILQLAASTPELSQGQWAFVSQDTINVNILEPNSPSAIVEGLPGGGPYAFTWSLSRGACTDFSIDTVFVRIKLPEPAYAGPDQLLCFGDTIRLAALPAQQGNGEWTQSQIQSDFNIFIDDELNPATTVSGPGIGSGNIYVFTWMVWSECGVEEDNVFITVSDNNPFAGPNQLICNDDAIAQLLAKEPAEGSTGSWSSPDGSLLFSSPDDIATGISNLRVGDNLIVWTLDNGFCGESSRDTLIINYQRNPAAVNDVVAIEFAIETAVNVLINDNVPPNSFIQIISGPMHGTARVISDSSFSYQPGINYIGEDRLVYEVCSDGCECDQAEVILRVGENAQCLPPNIITPNGDGINDTFTIPCLLNEGDYPNSQVSIFNRWGDEVYRSGIPYRNTWNGTYNGEELPADTYFYIVNLGDGRPPMSGYLLIQR